MRKGRLERGRVNGRRKGRIKEEGRKTKSGRLQKETRSVGGWWSGRWVSGGKEEEEWWQEEEYQGREEGQESAGGYSYGPKFFR